MLAGNMGGGAVNVLNNNGITVYRGCAGDVTELVKEFVNGQVDDSGETCNHHDNHEEGHHTSQVFGA
jgi:predicted Fe-Mo cluster-binding NifX family protein